MIVDRRGFAAALISALLLISIPASAALALVGVPALFTTETAAQAHCPRDVVVWLNVPTHIYHERGMRWYGRTKHGAYVCKKEADAAGDRDTRNGQ
jgi:hypothetical protein